jgi:carbon-monoxide dehydrogenase small subunit
MSTMRVELTINEKPVSVDVEPRTLLVTLLRDTLGMTGTHIGCDTTQCGACTVHVNGEAVKSCTILAAQASGTKVTTIEGLAKDGKLHPMQEAFSKFHALQCGYCTPGMIMTGIDIVRRGKATDEHTIREELEGNFCRCTGYSGIVKAIKSVGDQARG